MESLPELLALRVEENEVEVPDPPIQERIAAVVADFLKCTEELIEDVPECIVDVPVLPTREHGDEGGEASSALSVGPCSTDVAGALVKLVQEYAEAHGMVPFSPSWFAFAGASRLFRYLSDRRVTSHKRERERAEHGRAFQFLPVMIKPGPDQWLKNWSPIAIGCLPAISGLLRLRLR